MNLWFFSAGSNRAPRDRRSTASVRLMLEPLEDRCLPSATMMPAGQPMSSAAPASSVNTIASLPHDQIHNLQDFFHQQTQNATIQLEVEQIVFSLVQQFAPQAPQFQPLIAALTNAIPMQQATVQTLQNQSNLLDQLDDLQDQVIILNGTIQNDSAVIPALQQLGNQQAANSLATTIAADQAMVQALQPQIAAAEQEVSTFV